MTGSRSAPMAADPRIESLLFTFVGAENVVALQRHYLRHFTGARRVLDVGSGRGIFLDLLKEAGLRGVGIDASLETAKEVRARGHEVHVGDALTELSTLVEKDERFEGVFCSHLVEHLQPPDAIALVHSIAAVLSPGGRAVIVTPNPRNLFVIRENFWLDPTHVRPYPRQLLERLGESAGLRVAESYDDPNSVPGPKWFLARWARALRGLIVGGQFGGPLDSVVVYQKP